MTDKLKDHISGVAQGNLNAAEALFGIDANAFKNIRFHPEALAALKDMQADAEFWNKNGEKIRKQIVTVAAGTAEKTVTLATIAAMANKYGKPIINAKYNAALDQKKFGNYLEEKKLQAMGQFGAEQARHATQMQFQQAENSLSQAVFRANVLHRANQLRLKAESYQKRLTEQNINLRAEAAMQLGSKAPFLPSPGNIPTPANITPGAFTPSGMPSPDTGSGLGAAGQRLSRGMFGFISKALTNAVSRIRNLFGI